MVKDENLNYSSGPGGRQRNDVESIDVWDWKNEEHVVYSILTLLGSLCSSLKSFIGQALTKHILKGRMLSFYHYGKSLKNLYTHGWRDTVEIIYKHTKLIKVWTKKCCKLILDYFFFKWEGPLQRRKIMGMMNMNFNDFIILSVRIKRRYIYLKGSWSSYAAKLLQLFPTLCDLTDSSPPGSPIPGILQARTLEWFAISFSNAWKWKVKVKSLSRIQLMFLSL